MNRKVIVDEDAENSVHLFVGNWKSFLPSCQMVNNGENVLVSSHGDNEVCD